MNLRRFRNSGYDTTRFKVVQCRIRTALASILVRMSDLALMAAEAPAEPNTGAATVWRNFPSGRAYVPPKNRRAIAIVV